MKKIDLHPPFFKKKDAFKNLKNCIYTGWVSTSGKFIKEFEAQIIKYTGAKYAIALNSGTSALHLAIKLAGARKGDEIIAPTLTFVATINSIIYNLCSPVFMDCDDFFNIDSKKVTDFIKNETFFNGKFTINKKTKRKISILIVTHVWGNAADLKKLIKICKEKKINIVEDASESLGTRYNNGKHTGTLGLLGVFSFNANKIVTTGGGGMIVTNNKKLAKLAKYYSAQAKNDNINFVHNEVGYNYGMTNISAALGVSQMKNLDNTLKKKKLVYNNYRKILKKNSLFSIYETPSYATNNNWLCILKLLKKNENIIKIYLKKFLKKNIQVRPVWKLNHTQLPFKKFQKYKIKKANILVKKSLCLPSYSNLSNQEQLKILSILNEKPIRRI